VRVTSVGALNLMAARRRCFNRSTVERLDNDR
jgi:hypothetical protein